MAKEKSSCILFIRNFDVGGKIYEKFEFIYDSYRSLRALIRL